MTTHTEARINELRRKLRRVPALKRDASHQIASRHMLIAKVLVHENETAAVEHIKMAQLAAAHLISIDINKEYQRAEAS